MSVFSLTFMVGGAINAFILAPFVLIFGLGVVWKMVAITLMSYTVISFLIQFLSSKSMSVEMKVLPNTSIETEIGHQ